MSKKKRVSKNLPWYRDEIAYILFLAFAAVFAFIFYKNHGGDNIRADGLVYIEYFKRLFIDHKLIGTGIIAYPLGTTLFQLPFLLVTYLFFIITGTDISVISNYNATVTFAAFFYWAAGITICYRMLRRKFTKTVSLLTCISLSAGTMILEYFLDMSSYSHIYGFFICTLFFAYVPYYEEKRNEKNKLIMDFMLGFILGLAAIVRNTHIIIGAAYLFYKVTDFKSFIERIKKIIDLRLITQILGGAIPLFAQVIVWRLMSGKWMLYGYGDQSFVYLLKPQIFRVLFSDAKGLFIFCPILLVAVISMIAFRKENPEYRVAQWVIFAGVTYFVAAWWCWWLATAYGERMHCDILCIFFIPLASLYKNIGELWKEGKGFARYAIPITIGAVCVFFIVLNIIWFYGCLEWRISPNFATWYQLKSYLAYVFGT